MQSPLRILHLEDDPMARELVEATLRRHDIVCEVTAVVTEQDYRQALSRPQYDLILSDYTLPAFDGLTALKLARETCPDVPYLFVSGTLGEEQAIESLHNGATDYVLKHRLERLVPAVQRALREKEERARRQRAELLREEFAQLAQKLNLATTPVSAADIIVHVAKKLLSWDACTLDLYFESEDAIYPILILETHNGQETNIAVDGHQYRPTPLVRRCIEEGAQSVKAPELEFLLSDAHVKDSQVPCALMVPIRNGTRVTGILSIVTQAPEGYDEEDQLTLQSLADHCGGALERIWAQEAKSRLMEEVHRHQKRLDQLVASMAALIWETWHSPDPRKHQINFVSPYVETLLGYTVEEWLSHPDFWLTIVHPDDRNALLQAVASLNGGGMLPQFRWLAKDGKTIWCETSVKVIYGEDQTPLGLRGVALDITAQKEIEAQLLRSQRLESLGSLASGIAHDLNNILAPVLMSLEVLREKHTDQESAELISLAESYTKRGASIVRQILAFARGNAMERVVMDLNPLLEETLHIIHETFPKSIQASRNLPPDLWMLNGDPSQLHQVFLNLCLNARDAMPSGGQLKIRAENVLLDESCRRHSVDAQAGPYVAVKILDTGSGISAEIIDRIFDPFFTTKSPQGSGLGLSTALGIVKNHGGFITVDSQPGHGSEFSVYLPATPAGEVQPAVGNPGTSRVGEGQTILVVDDEPGIRDLAKRFLETHGFQILTAANIHDAEEIYRTHQNQIQLVLVDLLMPGGDGVQLIHKLKAIRPKLPFIVASGLLEPDRVAELESMDVKTRLAKPYSTHRLLAAIAREMPK